MKTIEVSREDIKIKIGDTELKLTNQEAENLFYQLQNTLNKQPLITYYPNYPNCAECPNNPYKITWSPDWNKDYTIITSSDNSSWISLGK